jgi:hypothetical protein
VTVAELIADLQRFPAHHVVAVKHGDGGFTGFGFADVSESYITDVTEGERGEVRIDVTGEL